MLLLISVLLIALAHANKPAPQPTTNPCTPLPINTNINLQQWVVSDWSNSLDDFPAGVALANKVGMYDSILPFNTSIYTNDGSYELSVFTTNWGTVTAPVPNVGVPGPFPYDEDWYSWGGDDLFEFGKSRYSGILADFGHTHIMVIHIQNEVLRANPSADITNIEMSLEHLAGGSSFIFGRFGQIIDLNGNFMDYSGDAPLVQMIKDVTKMFIFGNGDTYNQPGSHINLAQIDGLMTYLISAYNVSSTHAAVLTQIKNSLGASLASQLHLSSANPIALIAWDPLMKHHQNHTSHGFHMYTEYFTPPNNHPKLLAMNQLYRDGITMGRQMGAFFTAFYGFTDFMDKLVQYPLRSPYDYAIPLAYHAARTERVYHDQRRYWIEHTTMFEDYNKASALGNQTEIYRIRHNMLESCANIATTIGEIFRAYDTLIRYREMYTFLATM